MVRRVRTWRAWTDTDTAILKAALEQSAMTLREAAALFPDRSRAAVYRHIYRSGLRSLHPRGCGANPRRRA